jgi:hypothetical protein
MIWLSAGARIKKRNKALADSNSLPQKLRWGVEPFHARCAAGLSELVFYADAFTQLVPGTPYLIPRLAPLRFLQSLLGVGTNLAT